MVAHLTDRKYKHMVSNKLLPNCPITLHDITNENSMVVPSQSGLKVNTVRNKSSRLNMEEYMKNSEHFYKLNNFVMLAEDVMFVNGYDLMVTSARKVRLVTVEHITSQIDEQLSKILNKVIKLYGRGDFHVGMILV